MNIERVVRLEEIRDQELKITKAGFRMGRAIENHYTKIFNEGIEDVADGVIAAYLPYSIPAHQKDISLICMKHSIVFYPTNWAEYSTLVPFKYYQGGISINRFRKDKNPPGSIDEKQLVAMKKVAEFANNKVRVDGLVHHVHQLIMAMQSCFGDFEPYVLPEGGSFPTYMDRHWVVESVMNGVSDELEKRAKK